MVMPHINSSLLHTTLTHHSNPALLADKQSHILGNGEQRHVHENRRHKLPHLSYNILLREVLRLVTPVIMIQELIHLLVFQYYRLDIYISKRIISF